MMKVRIVPTMARLSRPVPAAMPTVAVSQILAAVVTPTILCSSLILRMTPPPMKPIPVNIPWMIRLKSALDIPINCGKNDQGSAEGNQHVGSHSRCLASLGPLEAQDTAEDDGE